MKIRALSFIIAIAAIALTGCNKTEQRTTPRRQAYPRIEVPDSTFTTVEGIDMHMEVNRAATATVERNDAEGAWVNVGYESPKASIHLTITPVNESTIDGVIDNRVERISLNLGGNDAEMISLMNPDEIEGRIFVSPQVTTPVQFIATDGKTFVVSGAALVAEGGIASADSLAPVTDMLLRDISHLLKTLAR